MRVITEHEITVLLRCIEAGKDLLSVNSKDLAKIEHINDIRSEVLKAIIIYNKTVRDNFPEI